MSARVHHITEYRGFVADDLALTTGAEILLRSPESITDWLAAKCMAVVRVAEHASIAEATPEDFTGWSVGRLLSLAFEQAQPAAVRAAALDRIAELYVADPWTKGLIDEEEQQLEFRREALRQEEREEAAADRSDCPGLLAFIRHGRA